MISPLKKISAAIALALGAACVPANADDAAPASVPAAASKPRYVSPYPDAQLTQRHKEALSEMIRERLVRFGIQRNFVPKETFGELFRDRAEETCGAVDPRFALGAEGAEDDAFSIPATEPPEKPIGSAKMIPIRIDFRYPEADGNVWEFGVALFERTTRRLFCSYALSKELTLGDATDLFEKIRVAGGLQRFPKEYPGNEYCPTEASAVVLIGARTDDGKKIFTDAGIVVRMIPIRGGGKHPEKFRVSVGAISKIFCGGYGYSGASFLEAVAHNLGEKIEIGGGRRLSYDSREFGKPLRVSRVPDFFLHFTERRKK